MAVCGYQIVVQSGIWPFDKISEYENKHSTSNWETLKVVFIYIFIYIVFLEACFWISSSYNQNVTFKICELCFLYIHVVGRIDCLTYILVWNLFSAYRIVSKRYTGINGQHLKWCLPLLRNLDFPNQCSSMWKYDCKNKKVRTCKAHRTTLAMITLKAKAHQIGLFPICDPCMILMVQMHFFLSEPSRWY